MNAVPILLIGIPAAVARYAQWKLDQQRGGQATPTIEHGDCWAGFDVARREHPPLAEMEVR